MNAGAFETGYLFRKTNPVQFLLNRLYVRKQTVKHCFYDKINLNNVTLFDHVLKQHVRSFLPSPCIAVKHCGSTVHY